MTLVLQKEFWSQQVLYVYLFAWLITLKWNALGWSGEIILEVDCLTKMSEEPSGGGTTFSLVAIPFYTILYIQSSTYNPLHSFIYNPLHTILSYTSFLAVQNSSIGDLVTHSLTQWLRHLLFFDIKERPYRPVTFETFDHSDEETGPD